MRLEYWIHSACLFTLWSAVVIAPTDVPVVLGLLALSAVTVARVIALPTAHAVRRLLAPPTVTVGWVLRPHRRWWLIHREGLHTVAVC